MWILLIMDLQWVSALTFFCFCLNVSNGLIVRTSKNSPVRLSENDETTLTCTVRKATNLDYVVWMLDDRVVTNGTQILGETDRDRATLAIQQVRTDVYKYDLTISPVDRRDDGRWTCRAFATNGRKSSLNLVMRVEYAPDRMYPICDSGDSELSCVTQEGNPRVSLNWYTNDSEQRLGLKQSSVDTNEGVITSKVLISSLQPPNWTKEYVMCETDYGNCSVTKRTLYNTTRVSIHHEKIPNAVRINCNVSNLLTGGSLVFEWGDPSMQSTSTVIENHAYISLADKGFGYAPVEITCRYLWGIFDYSVDRTIVEVPIPHPTSRATTPRHSTVQSTASDSIDTTTVDPIPGPKSNAPSADPTQFDTNNVGDASSTVRLVRAVTNATEETPSEVYTAFKPLLPTTKTRGNSTGSYNESTVVTTRQTFTGTSIVLFGNTSISVDADRETNITSTSESHLMTNFTLELMTSTQRTATQVQQMESSSRPMTSNKAAPSEGITTNSPSTQGTTTRPSTPETSQSTSSRSTTAETENTPSTNSSSGSTETAAASPVATTPTFTRNGVTKMGGNDNTTSSTEDTTVNPTSKHAAGSTLPGIITSTTETAPVASKTNEMMNSTSKLSARSKIPDNFASTSSGGSGTESTSWIKPTLPVPPPESNVDEATAGPQYLTFILLFLIILIIIIVVGAIVYQKRRRETGSYTIPAASSKYEGYPTTTYA